MNDKKFMLDNFLKEFKDNGEVYLRVKVSPGASKTEIKGVMEGERIIDPCSSAKSYGGTRSLTLRMTKKRDETIKINVRAVPEKGKANMELLKFLAKEFRVDKNNVKIISGGISKIKLVKIIK